MTLLLTGSDVTSLLTLDDCIAAVEEAFRSHGAAGILSAHADRGAFHIKAATVGGRFGAKANANFPGTTPSIKGVMLLFDTSDGRLLALLDSIELTVLRTGAATAVAAKYLARKDSKTVAVYGCGRQGRVQLEAIKRVLPIERVYAYDADPARASALAGADCVRPNPGEDADVIITCTPSTSAYLEHARPGTFIAAVGADNPTKSEIAPSLMQSSRVVADVLEQCAEIGDLRSAIAAGVMTKHDVHAELRDILNGRKPGRTNDGEVFIFDSTGVGFQDTAAASIAYDRAVEQHRGLEVDLAR
ncbi:MAG TPA: ornithine cyclodeaminase family protein [Thermoanaerobaculia bacterium]|nr:ornithine cyclodeaminase family protein [Thermoanaerobaculia bacterium]